MGNPLLARQARPHACPGVCESATPGIGDHHWDIRAVLGPAASLDPEGALALLPVAQTWSRCDLWEVADEVAHLAVGAERQAQSMDRGRQGRAEPPAGFSPTDGASMSASNAQRDITLRQRLADSLLNAFVENHVRLH